MITGLTIEAIPGIRLVQAWHERYWQPMKSYLNARQTHVAPWSSRLLDEHLEEAMVAT
jgi:hypothetical protein